MNVTGNNKTLEVFVQCLLFADPLALVKRSFFEIIETLYRNTAKEVEEWTKERILI